MTNRQYICAWPYGYGEPAPSAATHDLKFFTDDNGFTQDDFEAIYALEIGQAHEIAGPCDLFRCERVA